jgi:hypothetical protein
MSALASGGADGELRQVAVYAVSCRGDQAHVHHLLGELH